MKKTIGICEGYDKAICTNKISIQSAWQMLKEQEYRRMDKGGNYGEKIVGKKRIRNNHGGMALAGNKSVARKYRGVNHELARGSSWFLCA